MHVFSFAIINYNLYHTLSYTIMMKRKEDVHALIVRIEESIYAEIFEHVSNTGMSMNEFMKRAALEKMKRDRGEGAPQVSREELKELIREVLEERK